MQAHPFILLSTFSDEPRIIHHVIHFVVDHVISELISLRALELLTLMSMDVLLDPLLLEGIVPCRVPSMRTASRVGDLFKHM